MLPRLKRHRVLLLDDDPAVRRLVTLLLEREKCRVDVVTKGNDAIRSIARTSYDAVLLDLMMPHEGGLTVIAHLRAKTPAMLKRVVVLTAAPDNIIKKVEKEVFAIVRKPFDPADLTDAVKKLIA